MSTASVILSSSTKYGLVIMIDCRAADTASRNVVYIANGQDPEHGEGIGHLYAIDPTKRGDITKSGMIWHFDKIRRSISTAAIKDGLIYMADFSGFLHALDALTGRPVPSTTGVRSTATRTAPAQGAPGRDGRRPVRAGGP